MELPRESGEIVRKAAVYAAGLHKFECRWRIGVGNGQPRDCAPRGAGVRDALIVEDGRTDTKAADQSKMM